MPIEFPVGGVSERVEFVQLPTRNPGVVANKWSTAHRRPWGFQLIGGGDVITFIGTRRALREPIVQDVITFVGIRRALREPTVHAAAHVLGGGGRKGGMLICSLPCHDAFGLRFAFESGMAFSVVQRVHNSSKRKPLQEWFSFLGLPFL